MFAAHRMLAGKHLPAIAILLLFAGCAPARAAFQADTGAIGKPDAAQAPSATPAQSKQANVPPDSSKPQLPADPKAQKTFDEAVQWERQRRFASAIESFRKADKQDGGHCAECLRRAYSLALKYVELKNAEEIARDMVPQAATDMDRAAAHYRLAIVLQREGIQEKIQDKKEQAFRDSVDEFKAALTLEPGFTTVHYALGVSLAYLHQDDDARKEFTVFLAQDKATPNSHDRAQRFLANIDLARARMAPPFQLTTLDGRQVSMDGLEGQVVLIDFWATWCVPCREALPRIREIAHQFEGKPLVVLSISIDKDEDKWKSFVDKNRMTWLQYRDGSSDVSVAKIFGVSLIPQTFTIDADGVLEDQHVGDADIEGKIRKLVAHAQEKAAPKPAAGAQASSAGSGS